MALITSGCVQIDWIRQLRRADKLAYPTLWTILPAPAQFGSGHWASMERWGGGSFKLHLLCEWQGGHFLHERYAYPIFKPRVIFSSPPTNTFTLARHQIAPPPALPRIRTRRGEETVRAEESRAEERRGEQSRAEQSS